MQRSVVDIRHEKFAYYIVHEGLPASRAYALVYDKNPAEKSTQNMASRLLGNVGVQGYIESFRQQYLKHALEAYRRQWEMVDDPLVPVGTKMAFLSEVQTRAGFSTRRKHRRV